MDNQPHNKIGDRVGNWIESIGPAFQGGEGKGKSRSRSKELIKLDASGAVTSFSSARELTRKLKKGGHCIVSL
ncbi:hypothetical protein AK812_SmicGene33125 [Symbiodinium microadriaticum]|uniref:Uncharacterized protein n=1 Tax=Symbiodinium microadriaticum TaxID=2951 RepID=A0A1Q9CSD9_SYMMI|nr:hypothetical protein AK812_SmicGene33125 [Symbiodinium microadriaticum]